MTQPRRARRAQVRAAAVRAVLVLLAAATCWVAAAGPASAHNTLISTDPGDGARLTVAPPTVVLTFDQPALALGTKIDVTGPDGPVTVGGTRLIDTTVRQDLAGDTPAGSYTVNWRVTSIDGHPISGSFTFSTAQVSPHRVAAPVAPPAKPPSGVNGWTIALVFSLVGATPVVALLLLKRRRRRTSATLEADTTENPPGDSHG